MAKKPVSKKPMKSQGKNSSASGQIQYHKSKLESNIPQFQLADHFPDVMESLRVFDEDPKKLIKELQKEHKKDPNSIRCLILNWRLLALGTIRSFEELMDQDPKLEKKFSKTSISQNPMLLATTLITNASVYSTCAAVLEKIESGKGLTEDDFVVDISILNGETAEDEDTEDDKDEDEDEESPEDLENHEDE